MPEHQEIGRKGVEMAQGRPSMRGRLTEWCSEHGKKKKGKGKGREGIKTKKEKEGKR